MYSRGDVILGVGIVEGNHCGLPWPVDINGDSFFGVVQVGNIFCDAKSGKILSEKSFRNRKGNVKYNYKLKKGGCR